MHFKNETLIFEKLRHFKLLSTALDLASQLLSAHRREQMDVRERLAAIYQDERLAFYLGLQFVSEVEIQHRHRSVVVYD